jgi:hypothetical protein
VRKLWRRAAVGVSAIALAAGAVVAAMAAGAPAKPAAQVAQSQVHVVTAACTTARNYKAGYATFTYCDDQIYRVACHSGSHGDLFGPLYAANGCSTQLRMGTANMDKLCVNPQSSTNVLKKDYDQYSITGDTGPC